MAPSGLHPDLASALDDRLGKCRVVKIQCLLSDSDAGERIKKARLPGGWTVRGKLAKYGGFRHGEFEVSDGGRPAGIFHTVQAGDELYAATGAGAAFFSRYASRIIRGLHPHVLAATVNSETMCKILNDYERDGGGRLSPKESVRKKGHGAGLKTRREWIPRDAAGDRGTVEKVFADARDGGWHISSVRVFSGRESKPDLDLSVSCKGLVSVYAGAFEAVFAWLLRPVARKGIESRAMFGGRGRSETKGREPMPLLVDFGTSVFRDEQIRKEFTRIMERYPNCNYFVMHGGNPHTYISVLDKNDYSAFSIRTMGDSRLLIIPQIKASAASLMRFSEFLNESFREGKIQDHAAVAPGGARGWVRARTIAGTGWRGSLTRTIPP